MNESTNKLIEQLAEKLGTTVEYLWSVLLRQAPIEAVTNIAGMLLTVIFGLIMYKAHMYCAKPKTDNGYTDNLYEDGPVVVPMIFGGLILATMIIACILSFPDTINGFFNPEYWALDKVLSLSQSR